MNEQDQKFASEGTPITDHMKILELITEKAGLKHQVEELRHQLEQARREADDVKENYTYFYEEVIFVATGIAPELHERYKDNPAIKLVFDLRSQLTQLQKEVGEIPGLLRQTLNQANEISSLRTTLTTTQAELATAKATIEGLEKDRARLDWLEENSAGLNDVQKGHVWVETGEEWPNEVNHFHGENYRAAIDCAASQGTKKEGA